jgi:spore coat protein U-like protein
MAIEDAVHDQAQLVALEINAVIAHAEAMQGAACALEFAEFIEFGLHDLLGQAAKFAQNVQLQFLGHPGQFCGAGWVKDDLERTHVT